MAVGRAFPVVLMSTLLLGCGPTPTVSLNALYEDADRSLKEGDLEAADAALKQAHQRMSASPASDAWWPWQFRLLESEVLLNKFEYARVLDLLRENPPDDPRFESLKARSNLNRARAHYMLKQYDETDRLLDMAEKQAKASGHRSILADIEGRRGSLYARRGDFESAFASFRKGYAEALEAGDPYLQITILGNHGFTLINLSRDDEAVPLLELALETAGRGGFRSFLGRTAGNLGWCYYRLGDYGRALESLRKAESIMDELQMPASRQKWLGDIGNVYYSLQDYEQAVSFYQQALDLCRKLGEDAWASKWLSNLAAALIQKSEWERAEKLNEEALSLKRALGDKASERYSQINAARISAGRGLYDRAEKIYASILEDSTSSGDPIPLWEARAGLGELYARSGRGKEAEAQFDRALSLIEGVRRDLVKEEWKFTFQSHWIQFYDEYVASLMKQGRIERALEVVESNRALVLAEKLGLKQAGARAHAGQFREVARSYRSVLLSYWLGREGSYLWVTTPAGIRAFHLPAEREIRRLTQAYQSSLLAAGNPLEVANPQGKRLHEILIAPAAELLPAGTQVIIVPHGVLFDLNFETLIATAPRLRYWIEDVTLAVAPSLTLLGAGRGDAPTPRKRLLLIGDPVYAGDAIPSLPHLRREVAEIREQFAEVEAEVRTGALATPSAYQEAVPGDYAFIHFSAHAVANRESPLNSAVILSQKSAGSSGKLYAREVVNTPLSSQLVTLSSCSSAGARTYSGEGMVGFSWAFLQAGSRSVLAGLWDVNDRSTADFMRLFYRGLSDLKNPAGALRRAKLSLLASGSPYDEPYYWAPFQLYTRVNPFQTARVE